MKIKLLVATVLVFATSSAFALQPTNQNNIHATSTGQVTYAPVTSNSGNGSDLSNAVGQAFAPALTTTMTETSI